MYVFISLKKAIYGDYKEYNPLAVFMESEGMTMVVPRHKADELRIKYQTVTRCITLKVHSSLEAVGLTAAFSKKLSEYNISCNVIAGYYHDHIFVPIEDADRAMSALVELRD
jgi:hypothetical protein